MLSRLTIRNYALIENLDINFSDGLNILTGETGAGKSIILGALSLILGQRIEGKYFYNQQKKCIIEGYFNVANYNLETIFEEKGIDFDNETILRREISADGKSRAFINDSPVNLTILKELGEMLIDIHSQHATLEINDELFQLLVVDTLAANTLLLDNYQRNFNAYRKAISRFKNLQESTTKAKADLDYFQFQFDELEQASLLADEQESLEHELNNLSHAEEIKKNLLAASYLLNEDERSVITQLKESVNQLQQIERFFPEITKLTERLQSSLIELKDINAEVESHEQNTNVDEMRLAEVSERLDLIYKLQKKHRVSSISELINIRENLSDKLVSISSSDEELVQLEKEIKHLKGELIDISDTLSASRNEVIPSIEDKVKGLLAEVGMPNSNLKIENILLGEDELNVNGRNRIQFLFSANKGQAPAPMNKVASGGELSRLMLAIKSLISRHISLPTIIFDEIDTGISGEVALKVGKIMEKLSESMQVIAITHLPQIASKGNAHYWVYKDDREDITHTNIRQLNTDERVAEIAKMLSGENPGEFAIQHARELLEG